MNTDNPTVKVRNGIYLPLKMF